MDVIYPIKKIKVGSQVFFDGMPDYKPHDSDELYIMSGWFDTKDTVFRIPMKENGKMKDVFVCKNMSKEEFIQDYLSCDTPMRGNRFLVPEFADYIGLTIEDLKRCKPQFDNMDEKHEYLRTIYNFYIENKGFYLTEEQKEKAFIVYKERRK